MKLVRSSRKKRGKLEGLSLVEQQIISNITDPEKRIEAIVMLRLKKLEAKPPHLSVA